MLEPVFSTYTTLMFVVYEMYNKSITYLILKVQISENDNKPLK